jgi:hypothetical protein
MQPERHSCGLVKLADSAQSRCGLRYIGSADSCWPLVMRVMLFFLKGRRLREAKVSDPEADAKSSTKPQLPPQPVAPAPV